MYNKKKLLANFERNILLLGFILNFFWIMLIKTQPFSDFLYYHELAKQIANGGQWGSTYTTVGYSIVLGFFYKIFGANIETAKYLNLLLSIINSLLVFKILTKMALSKRTRKTILVLFIIFPMNIYYNSILGSEILFTTLLLLIIYVYLADIQHKYLIIGFLTGINTMIKPFFILFFLVILLTELINNKKITSGLIKCLIVLGVSIIAISPWLYRNYKLIGQFTYVSNNSGIVLYINNNSQNKNGGWMPAEEVANSIVNLPEYQLANRTQQNKMLTNAAIQWIKTHPKDFLILGMKRLHRTYFYCYPSDVDKTFDGTELTKPFRSLIVFFIESIKEPIYFIGIITIFICSILIIFKRLSHSLLKIISDDYQNNIFLLLIFYMFTGIYFITEGQSRYSFPLIFIIIYYFSISLEYLRKIIEKYLIK